MNPAFRLAWLPAMVVVPRCPHCLEPHGQGDHTPTHHQATEYETRFIALSNGRVTGRAGRITRPAVPRLWPFTRLPRLGDPSEPSLAPQTAEPCSSRLLQPCTRTVISGSHQIDRADKRHYIPCVFPATDYMKRRQRPSRKSSRWSSFAIFASVSTCFWN